MTQTGAIQNSACSKPPVRILRGTSVYNYYSLLRVAYNVAVNGDIIQARAVNFTSEPIPLNLNRPVNVTIKGGYDCGYTKQIENSVLVNSLIISQGTVTMGNFEVMAGSYAKEKVYTIRYRPFGETLSDYGLLSVNHKYTSQEFDAETGLYNYNARFYNPSIGRFISANPVVSDPTNPQALNRFSYVLNSPLRYIDPSGYDEYDTSLTFYADPYNRDYGYFNYYDQLSSPYSSSSFVPYDSNSGNSSLSWGSEWGNSTVGYNSDITGESSGLFSGFRDYIKGRCDENWEAGNYIAAGIDWLGIQTTNYLLPHSFYEMPLMFMPVKMARIPGYQVHHLLPQARTLAPHFEKAGLNINEFTVNLATDAHIFKPYGIHTGQNNWNKAWYQFFEKNPTANDRQILEHLDTMVIQFGIPWRRLK